MSGTRLWGSRVQVPGSRYQGLGARCSTSSSRCQVPGSVCHAPGIRDEIVRNHVSYFRDQLQRQNVKHLHIKNILRLNENYKLLLHLNGNYGLTNIFFTTLIFSLAHFRKTKEKMQLPIMSSEVCFLGFSPQIR